MNCELCETQLAGDAYLCPACTAAAAQQLAAFPHLYRDLAEELVPLGSNWPSRSGGHGTRAEAPLPVVEHPLVLRAGGGMVSLLESWRVALHADRGWTEPVIEAGVEPRVRAAVKALTVNLPWIAAEWPVAGDFAGEIGDLYAEVASITAPDPRPGVRIGYCPAVVDGCTCGAVLRLERGEDVIRCPWCRSEFPQRLWSWLRNVQDELEKAS